MVARTNVPAQIAQSLQVHKDSLAFSDRLNTLTYGELADFTARVQRLMPRDTPIAVFGKPSTLFGAAATACVLTGRPFVHLDPAMPEDVLRNILAELGADVVFCADPPAPGQLPDGCTQIDIAAVLLDRDSPPLTLPDAIADDDFIYIVATSGTTGKPKCIPVTQISAHLSYEWRDAFTPYASGDRMGAYIFAIWEMFRPLRTGASVHFAQFSELLNPADLVGFWQRCDITEMLFTPSALEKTLQALPPQPIDGLSLRRIILNGEVVSDALIEAVRKRLPNVRLWNLYSICETHDVSMTDVTERAALSGPVSVGVPMPHLRAVVLDDTDTVCAPNVPGLLHFEGPKMLGPGYINRPEETALRFRELTLNGAPQRLYDTGDQAYVDASGEVFVMGRIAHMLKLRGHSIQTTELTESLHTHIAFGQAVPWIQDIAGHGKALVFYYACDEAQAAENAQKWGLEAGQMRPPAELSRRLRTELPAYCVPSYLVQLDEIPINAVSGKCDYKRLPEVVARDIVPEEADALPTLIHSARVMGCAPSDLDPALSFHAQGGDSLMAVTLLLALEEVYGSAVDFDFALNVPLGRLHELLSRAGQRTQAHAEFTRKGILLTGATGFLGSRVLAAAAKTLPADQVIYCVVREKRAASADRLHRIAAEQGVDAARLVLITASIDDTHFALDAESYAALTGCVQSVIHCAAMVNLAVDRSHTEQWSQTGMANVLQLCKDAGADLRFTSSSAVFPDVGGPHPEAPGALFDGCSGYGAAKIDAEARIEASGVPAAIVRLPSLYALDAPNEKDIYEIIMGACKRLGAVPEGLSFRMVDVHSAAAFLMGLPPSTDGVTYHNFGPDILITPDMVPPSFAVLPQHAWLQSAPLSDAERSLIAADLDVLRATCSFVHQTAHAAWQKMTGTDLCATSDPRALVTARFTEA